MKRRSGLLAVGLVASAIGVSLWVSPGSIGDEQVELEVETLVAVHVAPIRRTTLRRYVTAYGRVEPEPAGAKTPGAGSQLASQVAGTVVEVLCSEGQRVEQGDLLFRLDSRVADVEVEFAVRELARQRLLLDTGGTSEQNLREAERRSAAARAERALLRIQAPFAGVVVRVDARPGEAVNPGSVLGELNDPAHLVASAGVPAAELDELRPGQPVHIRPAGRSAVEGTLLYVSSRLDPRTGLATVRASLLPDSGLRAGEFVSLRIVSDEHADRLAVPVESVVRGEDGTHEIAVLTGDRARKIPVSMGLRDGGLVEVEGEGLREGMQVVTAGAYGLPAQSRVRILP